MAQNKETYERKLNPHLAALLDALGVSENDFMCFEHNKLALSPRTWLHEKLTALGYAKK